MAGSNFQQKQKNRGRPPKNLLPRCPWCKRRSDNLKYIMPMPTPHANKAFCSQSCLSDFHKVFRKNHEKGLCVHCDSIIEDNLVSLDEPGLPNKNFCSTLCLDRYKKINYQKRSDSRNSVDRANKMVLYSNFNWETYLKETDSSAAPPECFKQFADPPVNEFKPGMKLEALDPRNITSNCIATVIATLGPRLRLRLDGTDNQNDFWRLVDSNEIHEIGFCQRHNMLLTPPLGFTLNVSSWPTFRDKTLKEAIKAPEGAFKPEPPTPSDNFFEVGMKIEAVDRKNPHLICAATIGKIKGEMVHISFDGWNGAFDYWCRYDSRDIFPVGWCRRNGHPLQPPGKKFMQGSKRFNLKPCNILPVAGPSSIDSDEGSSKGTVKKQESTEPVTSSVQKPSTTLSVYVNSSCKYGPYLNPQKVSDLPTQYGPTALSRVLKLSVQNLVLASTDQKQVIGLIRQGHGKAVISATVDKENVTIRLPGVKKIEDYWSFIQELLEELQCCENFYTREPLEGGCMKCQNLEKSEVAVLADCKSEPVENFPGKKRSWSEENQNTVMPSTTVVAKQLRKSVPTEMEAASSTTQNESLPKLPSDASEWSVEDVIQHIAFNDPALGVHADLFRTHEIDGKALILLNSDMMMKYMGLKLGPALKICNIVNKVKGRRHLM